MLYIEARLMIKDMYRKGVSISEIARRTGRDRKTIRQIVTAPGLAVEPAPRKPKPCKIDPYIPYLEQRMEEGVLNARKLYGELVGMGYPGGETQVRGFVQKHRPEHGTGATTRFEPAPGAQGQVHWAHLRFITHQRHPSPLPRF